MVLAGRRVRCAAVWAQSCRSSTLPVRTLTACVGIIRECSFRCVVVVAGILSSYFINLGVNILYSGWRYSLSVEPICGVILFIGCFFLPESPRW